MKSISEYNRENKKLIKKNERNRVQLTKSQTKLDKRGINLPLQKVWELKDRIKELEHTILINEQQIRLNLMLKLNTWGK